MPHKEFIVRHDFYTTASPEDFWIEILHTAIYRSSMSGSNPVFLSQGKLRSTDFKLARDPFVNDRLIIPSPFKGLSFADSIETLRNKKVAGKFIFRGQRAWVISQGSLPEGFVINYTEKTHPPINVCRPMKESEFIDKINSLLKSGRYFCTNIKV